MKGDKTVIENLFAAASMEANLVEQYRVDYLSMEVVDAERLEKLYCKYYDDSEEYLERLVKRLAYFDQNPSYSSGDVKGPGEDWLDTINDALERETKVVEAYQGFCKQAWDALDDNTRNIYEHLIKWHECHIAKLEKEIEKRKRLGDEAYLEYVLGS